LNNKRRNFGGKADFRNTTNHPLNPVQMNNGDDTVVALFTVQSNVHCYCVESSGKCVSECDECAEM